MAEHSFDFEMLDSVVKFRNSASSSSEDESSIDYSEEESEDLVVEVVVNKDPFDLL